MDLPLRKQIDFGLEFKEWYLRILDDFGFDYFKDCEARDYLNQILNEKEHPWNLETVLKRFKSEMVKRKNILLIGCGPSLEETFEFMLRNLEKNIFSNSFNLVADGASMFLKEKGVPINAVFTDLDGIDKEIFDISAFMVVHAHGDNIDKIRYFAQEILSSKNLIATTQVESIDNIINPGGFTDGDRILFFIKSLLQPFHRIFLIGMDFQTIVGKYSKPRLKKNTKADPIKIKKLKYAINLIEWLKNSMKNEIYLVNSSYHSTSFINLTLNQLNVNLFY